MLSAFEISKNFALGVINTENGADNAKVSYLLLRETIMKEAVFGSSRQ